MKQEEKELLLKDLSARLFYGVKFESENAERVYFIDTSDDEIYINGTNIEDVKPYLFPMSSMTEKQIDELKDLCDMYDPVNDNDYCEDWGTRLITKNIMNDGYRFNFNFKLFEFLNKNKLDYRGLIEKGLAIDATNLNIY